MTRRVVVRHQRWSFMDSGHTPAPSIALMASVVGEAKTIDGDPLGAFDGLSLLRRHSCNRTYFQIQLLDKVTMGKQCTRLISSPS
jgi:hypothetical protein